jgi:hypothetical protein
MRVIFPNLDTIQSSQWEHARGALADDLARLQATINTTWDVAHHVDGTQKAESRGQLLGQISGTLAEQPTGLTADDDGLLYFVSDYHHLMRWNGSTQAWTFAPGDPGNGFFADFAITPPTAGWALCDGSSVNYLTVGATLTTGSLTLPNLNGTAAYRKSASSYSGTIVGAGTSGAGGDHDHGAATGNEASHTHGVNITAVADSTHYVTVDAGSQYSVNNIIHVHAVTGNTGAGSTHAHSIGSSGTHTHTAADPAHVDVKVFFRL